MENTLLSLEIRAGDVLCGLKTTYVVQLNHIMWYFVVQWCLCSRVCSGWLPCCPAWALFSLGSWWVLPESGPAAELSSVSSWQAACPWFALALSPAALAQPWHLPASRLSLPSPAAMKEQKRRKSQVGSNSSCCDTLRRERSSRSRSKMLTCIRGLWNNMSSAAHQRWAKRSQKHSFSDVSQSRFSQLILFHLRLHLAMSNQFGFETLGFDISASDISAATTV